MSSEQQQQREHVNDRNDEQSEYTQQLANLDDKDLYRRTSRAGEWTHPQEHPCR